MYSSSMPIMPPIMHHGCSSPAPVWAVLMMFAVLGVVCVWGILEEIKRYKAMSYEPHLNQWSSARKNNVKVD